MCSASDAPCGYLAPIRDVGVLRGGGHDDEGEAGDSSSGGTDVGVLRSGGHDDEEKLDASSGERDDT